jgi:hypothetical protein
MHCKFLPILIAVSLISFSSERGFCQSPTEQSTERIRIARPASEDQPTQTAVSPALSGSAEQHEFIDPAFSEVPHLTDTPPLKGKANPLSWLLMPNAGQNTFKTWMESAHPKFALSSQKNDLDENELIEIIGEHESLHRKTRLFSLNCRRIYMDVAFIQSRNIRRILSGRPPKVLIYDINCSCSLNEPDAVKQYVKNGGYLLVAGRNMVGVAAAFPERVTSTNGSLNRDELVDAELYKPDQVLGNSLVTNARWYMPAGFPSMKVLNPQAVRVLCSSHELAQKVPDGQGVLAALFPYGRGYVLCLAGPIDNNIGPIQTDVFNKVAHPEQLPDPAPVIHISLRQGIAANFIEAGLTQKRIPTGISEKFRQ